MGNVTHGMTGTPTFRSWSNMVQRCTNSNNHGYKNYGGRGIRVCQRWMTFGNFFEDMGVAPLGHSIERNDNSKGYEPGNCRWATRVEQNRNKRNNRRITFRGETLTFGEWATRIGIREPKLRERFDKGWPIDLALTLPPSKHNSVRRSKKSKYNSNERSCHDQTEQSI